MKKIILSLSVIFSFLFYAFHQKFGVNDEVKVTPTATVVPNPVSNQVQSTPVEAVPPASAPTVLGNYRDGSFTGDVADAYYGNIQVKAMIQRGKIVDVQFLQYPNDRETSIAINTQAMPILKQEAIKVQNANVDIVSGATQSSEAFRQSLQSALDQAKI